MVGEERRDLSDSRSSKSHPSVPISVEGPEERKGKEGRQRRHDALLHLVSCQN